MSFSQQLLGWFLLESLNTVRRNHTLLVLSDVCLSSIFSFSQVMEISPHYSGCYGREMFLPKSVLNICGRQALTHHSPFLLWERLLWPVQPLTVPHLERGSAGKVPLIFSRAFRLTYIFASVECWRISLGSLEFYKGSVFCGYLPESPLSRCSPA